MSKRTTNLKKEHELIERYIKGSNFNSAMIYIDKILNENPNEFKTLVYKSKCEMANELYDSAEQTLITAMSLQPEKPLAAMAFVCLSDLFRVQDESCLKRALQLMRSYCLNNGDVDKFQVYSLKLLRVLVKSEECYEEIEKVYCEIGDTNVPQQDKYNMLMLFYQRQPQVLSDEQQCFLFEVLKHRLLNAAASHMAPRDDGDDGGEEQLEMYKKFCDLGYKSNKIMEIFNCSTSILAANPEAWILHGELLYLIELEVCENLAQYYEWKDLEDNSTKVLLNIKDLLDDGFSVKSSIKVIATSLLYFTNFYYKSRRVSQIGETDLSFGKEKNVIRSEFNDQLAKLVKNSKTTSHEQDCLLKCIIVYLNVKSFSPSITPQSITDNLNELKSDIKSCGKMSACLKVKLDIFLSYLEVTYLRNCCVKMFHNEIIQICARAIDAMIDLSSTVMPSSSFVKKKFLIVSGEAYLYSKNYEQAEHVLNELEQEGRDEEYWLLNALINNKKGQSYAFILGAIENGLNGKADNVELLLLQVFIQLKYLCSLKTSSLKYPNGKKQLSSDSRSVISNDLAPKENPKDGADVKLSHKNELHVLNECFELIERCEQMDVFNCEVHQAYAVYFYSRGLFQDALIWVEKCWRLNKYHLKSIKLHSRLVMMSSVCNYESVVDLYKIALPVFSAKIQYSFWLRTAVHFFYTQQYHASINCILHCRPLYSMIRNTNTACEEEGSQHHHDVSWLLIAIIYYKTNSFQSALSCSLKSLQLLQKHPSFLVDAYKSNLDFRVGCFIAASSRFHLNDLIKANDDFHTAMLATDKNNSFYISCEKIVCSCKIIGNYIRNGGSNKSGIKFEYETLVSFAFKTVDQFCKESYVWKVLADTLMLSKFFAANDLFEIPSYLLQTLQTKSSAGVNNAIKITRVDKRQLMFLSYQCYLNVIQILHSSDDKRTRMMAMEPWVDISKCSFAIGTKELLKKAVKYAKIAVSLDKNNPQCWVYLASLASTKQVKQYNLAQHCFITAFILDQHNLTPLTHLAFVYLKTGKYESAHKIFDYIGQQQPCNASYLFYKQMQNEQVFDWKRERADTAKSDMQSSICSPSFVLNTLYSLNEQPLQQQIVFLAKYLLRDNLHHSLLKEVQQPVQKGGKEEQRAVNVSSSKLSPVSNAMLHLHPACTIINSLTLLFNMEDGGCRVMEERKWVLMLLLCLLYKQMGLYQLSWNCLRQVLIVKMSSFEKRKKRLADVASSTAAQLKGENMKVEWRKLIRFLSSLLLTIVSMSLCENRKRSRVSHVVSQEENIQHDCDLVEWDLDDEMILLKQGQVPIIGLLYRYSYQNKANTIDSMLILFHFKHKLRFCPYKPNFYRQIRAIATESSNCTAESLLTPCAVFRFLTSLVEDLVSRTTVDTMAVAASPTPPISILKCSHKYFSTLDAKYLCQLVMSCLHCKLFSLVPSFKVKLVTMQQHNHSHTTTTTSLLYSTCIKLCELIEALSIGKYKLALVIAQRTFHLYPWLKTHSLMLNYSLQCYQGLACTESS